jgi:hypothetical protein
MSARLKDKANRRARDLPTATHLATFTGLAHLPPRQGLLSVDMTRTMNQTIALPTRRIVPCFIVENPMERKTLWEQRLNGTVEVSVVPHEKWPATKSNDFIKSLHTFTWHPPYQVACQLPPGFVLQINCMKSKDARRFIPAKPTTAFVFEASLAGHALLADRDQEGVEDGLSHHEARLFNQFSRHLREYLGGTLKLGRLLKISPTGRPDRATSEILPEDIGLDIHGRGKRWTVRQLKEEGREAAQESGIESPTPDQTVWYGLYRAAKLNPLPSNGGDIAGLLRLAFFTLGLETPEVHSDDIEYVRDRVQESLLQQRDVGTDEFRLWIEDPKSNLIRRIAKRADCRLSRQQVRAALIELGWQSFRQLGQCVDTVMASFLEALPNRLCEADQALFSRMYLAQQDTGGMPLILLHDRFEVLRPAILEIWSNPTSPLPIQVLWQMIYWYSNLVENRRSGDRRSKQRAANRNESGRAAMDHSLETEVDTLDSDDPSRRRGRRSKVVERF